MDSLEGRQGVTTRRKFLLQSTAAVVGAATAPLALPYSTAANSLDSASFSRRRSNPKLTFYGAARKVSGSCHLLETTRGLYLVDCGMYMGEAEADEVANREFPFDPAEVQAVFLTHAHTDHNGRLPLLYRQGFRGPIYCTDATRDITRVMLELSAAIGADSEDEPMYDPADVERTVELLDARPYNSRFEIDGGIGLRMTDAGHILGSAMIEVWADGRKLLFSGDMGPDPSPIMHSPTQHFGADAVLVESTYGPVADEAISYEEVGRRIAAVLERGGSVLLPSFALHKTQILIYVLHQLVEDGIIPRDTPIYSDSSTARVCTRLYDIYHEYYDHEAQQVLREHGSLFYRGRYREGRVPDILATHRGGQPAIYIATSGMLSHAAAPRHLIELAADRRNAVFVVGYQAPGTPGRKLLDGQRRVELPVESGTGPDRRVTWQMTQLNLEVGRLGGFSSHARGQQILDWASRFETIGPLYTVHGDEDRAVGLANRAREMRIEAAAPRVGETFEVTGERNRPGPAPRLRRGAPDAMAPVDR